MPSETEALAAEGYRFYADDEVSSKCFSVPVQPVTPEERKALVDFWRRTEKILAWATTAEVYILRKIDVHGVSETVGAFATLDSAQTWYREPLKWRTASAHSWDAVDQGWVYEIERLEVK